MRVLAATGVHPEIIVLSVPMFPVVHDDGTGGFVQPRNMHRRAACATSACDISGCATSACELSGCDTSACAISMELAGYEGFLSHDTR